MLTAITLEPSTERIIEARKAVADALAAASVPVPDAERVILAVSELVSNAVQHGPPTEIRVEVDVEGDEIELRVRQRAEARAVPVPESWHLPDDPAQTSGRGLAIVAAVSDSVEVVVESYVVEIRARFVPRSNPPTTSG